MSIAYVVSGLLVGFVVGLSGVGGGSLMTPLLILLFGFKPAVAVGTDLLFAALTKGAGTFVHHNTHKSVEWKIVGWLSLGSIPSAIIMLWMLHHHQTFREQTGHFITWSLAIALILTALALLYRVFVLREVARSGNSSTEGRFHRMQGPATMLVGAVLGVLVTLSSVGAGALGTMAIFYLYPRMSTLKVVGTDLAHAIPLTAVAGLGHMQLGHVDFTLLLGLLVGSVPGIWLGSHISGRIPDKVLKVFLASLLLLIGSRFLTQ